MNLYFRAMEIKIQMEAVREEKRRKEALAERRAQHIEATMRYQRGLKNFKINKGKRLIYIVNNFLEIIFIWNSKIFRKNINRRCFKQNKPTE